MKQFSSIIFDLDGTLWDSLDTCLDAWNEALQNQNIKKKVTKQELRSVLGLQHRKIANILFPSLKNTEKQTLMDEIAGREIVLIQQKGGTLYPNTETVLKKLAEDYRLFIVSNCQKGYIEAFLTYYEQFEPMFEDFESSGNTGKAKAYNLQLVKDRNDLSNPIYVGDTKEDQKACQQIGMPFIYASYGFGKVEKADYEISQISDLITTTILKQVMG